MANEANNIMKGHQTAGQTENVNFLKIENYFAIFKVGSGDYNFVSSFSK